MDGASEPTWTYLRRVEHIGTAHRRSRARESPLAAFGVPDNTRITPSQHSASDTVRQPARNSALNKFDDYSDRVADLAGKVGDAVKEHIPDHAMRWIETGAAIGAIKTGSRVARTVIKRNPVIAVAAVAGAGLLWYAARRRARRVDADGNAIDGEATRITATRRG